MKIDDRNAVPLNPADVARAQAAESAQQQQAAQNVRAKGDAPASDRVALSELSARIRELVSGSPEREARIAKLAEEFAAGRYAPDADAIADALIAEAEMGGGDEGL